MRKGQKVLYAARNCDTRPLTLAPGDGYNKKKRSFFDIRFGAQNNKNHSQGVKFERWHNAYTRPLSWIRIILLKSLNNVQVSSLSQFIEKVGLTRGRSDNS
jgi:hypothetical protein